MNNFFVTRTDGENGRSKKKIKRKKRRETVFINILFIYVNKVSK